MRTPQVDTVAYGNTTLRALSPLFAAHHHYIQQRCIVSKLKAPAFRPDRRVDRRSEPPDERRHNDGQNFRRRPPGSKQLRPQPLAPLRSSRPAVWVILYRYVSSLRRSSKDVNQIRHIELTNSLDTPVPEARQTAKRGSARTARWLGRPEKRRRWTHWSAGPA